MDTRQRFHINALTGYSFESIMAMNDADFHLFKIGPLAGSKLDYKQVNYLNKQRHEFKKRN